MKLRYYQQELFDGIKRNWSNGDKNVLAVAPTGAGKTVLMSAIVKDHNASTCVIAHRQELVSQISLALARQGIRHTIIGTTKLIKMIVNIHMIELGRNFYDPNSRIAVAGVDTITRRADKLQRWCNGVTLWMIDEAHHVLRNNKWGKAVALFPNAKGLGVTATPCRADGAGLGRHADGVIDSMLVSATMRTLIDEGYLTDYRIFCPPSDLDLVDVHISKTTGDYNQNEMRDAVKKSTITGDVVSHYKKIAQGKLGVTFVPTVEQAEEVAENFNKHGVIAKAVSAKTPDDERAKILRQFKNREILQLVNCDLFGEGFDLPAIEVVSMARPTASYSLYVQQFGRALRLMEGKEKAIIIDHVGNVIRHGLPDTARDWSLDRREKKSQGVADAIPLRRCLECVQPFKAYLKACPHCGTPVPVPEGRNAPEFVDGDLEELDAETLNKLRGEVAKVDISLEDAITEYRRKLQESHTKPMHILAHVKRFGAKLEEQKEKLSELRENMAQWAGYLRHAGRSNGEIFKAFYLSFGIDWLSAQALSSDAMVNLNNRVSSMIGAEI